MKSLLNNLSTKIPRGLIYLFLMVIGIFIMLFCSMVQNVKAPMSGEGYYSYLLINSYTLPAKALFFTSGFLVGYIYKLDPWFSGLCLFLVFPLTSVIEGAVYKDSHNLLGLEFAFHFWIALPTIIAVYIGSFISRQVAKQKVRI